jgi:hypothetical protein
MNLWCIFVYFTSANNKTTMTTVPTIKETIILARWLRKTSLLLISVSLRQIPGMNPKASITLL